MKTKVYDLPTRIFHWLFTLLFFGAFAIAKLNKHNSDAFPFHMILGLTLLFVVSFRVIWGLVGSRYALFNSFDLKISSLKNYFKQIRSGNTNLVAGHNPASSWAAVIMIACSLALALTGYITSRGHEDVGEIHEIISYVFLLTALAHIAGVIMHQLRHRDQMPLSMIHGSKEKIPAEYGIKNTHVLIGILLAIGAVAFLIFLRQNYNPTDKQLRLGPIQINLGDPENGIDAQK